MMTQYLTENEFIAMNRLVIEAAGEGSIGLQSPEGLNSIQNAVQQVVFGQELYPTIWLKAAYLMQKITKKHIFADGNKRSSFQLAAYFLLKNGYDLTVDPFVAEEFILTVTNTTDSEEVMLKVAEWFEMSATKIK